MGKEYIYIYICVCVCVCRRVLGKLCLSINSCLLNFSFPISF